MINNIIIRKNAKFDLISFTELIIDISKNRNFIKLFLFYIEIEKS